MPFILLFGLFIVLAVRLFQIQVLQGDKYERAADKITTRTETIPAGRGTIYDRNGQTLAFSRPSASLIADPVEIRKRSDLKVVASWLAPLLQMTPVAVFERINSESRYRVVKKQLTASQADVIRKESRKHKVLGLTFEEETLRVYPLGTVASHALGFCGPRTMKDPSGNDHPYTGGVYGIEARYDELLRGQDGERCYTALTNPYEPGLYRPDEEIEPESGADIYLSLDAVISSIVSEELSVVCEKFRPQWATAIAMDPNTGDVLAVESFPTFDPNNASKFPVDNFLNRAVSYAYTPGSVMKPFILGAALEQKVVDVKDQINCENGDWVYGKRRIHDHEKEGVLSLTQVLAQSSNIGFAKIGLKLGIDRTERYIRQFGFGRRTGIELPGEVVGMMTPRSQWTDVYTLCSVSFGHEISVTPMRLATSFSLLANGGTLIEPHLLDRVNHPDGRVTEIPTGRRQKVLGDEALAKLVPMMAEVMISGTGKPVASKWLPIAGKTGTTVKDKAKNGAKAYASTFVGFAPVESPKLLVLVVLDEPKGAYYGSQVAAPAAVRILERGIKALGLAPNSKDVEVAQVPLSTAKSSKTAKPKAND